MNYYDAQQLRLRAAQRQPVDKAALAEANAYVQQVRRGRPGKQPEPVPQKLAGVASPMDALCTCGLRYGMHRVNDHACPNQQWKPGNGEAQWLEANKFFPAA